MNSKQLYYFTVIAETGSFTLAAAKLGLSQPPLSKQIMALEEELSMQLLERGPRNTRLTAAGALLYQRARDILSMMDAAQKEVLGLKNSPKGILKLGTISSCGPSLIHSYLPKFCSDFPKVRYEITEGNTYQLLEKLKNGVIECAIIRTPFNTDGLHCVYGPTEPLIAAGAPHFFETLPDPSIHLEDLAGKPLIYYRRFDALISLAFQNIGQEPHIFCRNDDARTSLLWAKTGLGIALVPKSICQDPQNPEPDLTKKIILSEDTDTRMAAVYKKNGYVSDIAKEFVKGFQL